MLKNLILFCSLIILLASQSIAAEGKVLLPLNAWASQRVLTNVLANKLIDLGYKVEFVEISSTDQWGALRKGLVHAQIEVWNSSDSSTYKAALSNRYVIDMGSHDAIGREDWWYPEYVESLCPGLPDWQALNNCAELFSEDQSDIGIYYTGPWNYRDADLIRALNLNFKIKRLSDAKSLWHKLNLAIATKQPLLILNWTPNWIDVRIKGRFVEFPAYSYECETDPGWGLNKKMLYDCGNLQTTELRKAAWPKLEVNFPCVYQIVKKINFTNEMIAEASALVMVDGYSEQDAARAWLSKYEKSNQDWLEFQCMAR